ncbi:chromosome segregation protein SMC [Thiopseudomonas denitrificans]|uniref:Chromosome partition protein Smc n=1 Tax=Thiopseudomonas denitrificans TaxID=1501432 RepID=A0A4V3D5C0_9GAMM|nr:chromosome segregation protein SMC [Thiopseudomonas denitrificans]TDQ39497.1 condensin subunit Smc [Thiopseudomonas denitrificans]
MRLKCIRLSGFKSFVDPTTVSFPGNMTAVVGPNGCGKSNIIDAVRWVLGESSAKNLRGEAMTDVIFNGSTSRKPVSRASIELVFDNTEGRIPGEYASYAEISVRRQVTREGQSTYYLNGTKCRRRDITDLFLGTGLGPRSYAIIEQGMISRLVEARPDDLRIFIEEAAGISKYKERRRETENRMRRTQDNLARLSDLREELGRQLERLQRQAQAAERYQQLREHGQRFETQLTAMRWRALDEQALQLQQLLDERETALQAQISLQYQADAQTEQLRDQHHDRTESFNRVQARFYLVGAEIARSEQAIQHARQRLQQLQDDLRDAERQREETESQLAGDRDQLEQLECEEQMLLEELAQAGERHELAQAGLLQADDAWQQWQEQWQAASLDGQRPREELQRVRLQLQQLGNSGQQLQQRIQRLDSEQDSLQADMADAGLQVMAEEQALLQEQVLTLQLQQEEQQERLHALQQQEQQLQQQLNERRSRLHQLQGQSSALRALQEQTLQQDDDLLSWLQGQDLRPAGRVLDGLQVEPGWELAVETVLAGDLQALCVDSWPEHCNGLQEGNLRLVREGARLTPVAGSLLEKVRASSLDLSPWLGQVRPVASLAEALQQLPQLAAGHSLVTADGCWLSQSFFRLQRGEHQQQGLLQRARLLEQLTAEQELLEQELEQQEQHLQRCSEERGRLQQESRQLREREQQDGAELARLQSRLAAGQARSEQLQQRLAQARDELQELREQQQQEQERQAELQLQQEQAEEAVRLAEAGSEQLQQRQAGLRQQHEQARQLAGQQQQRWQELQLQHGKLVTRRQATMQALERLQQQIERAMQRQEQLALGLADGESPVELLQAKLEEQLQQRLQVDDELRGERLALEELDDRLRQMDRQRHEASQQAEQIRADADQLRLNWHTLKVQRDALDEQLREAGDSVQDVLLGLPADAGIDDWQRQLEQLGSQIQRLGAINLAAIEEYRQQSERKTFLDAQNDDLEEALATLENVIRKIDRETRQRFKDTFEQINSGLQTLFPKVFGGGLAWLELTGDDLLDTGVAIMARPPGKKNSTIHLLSGGEKALTALALVFAIFQLNPAPFCMLDEVDAPLDDANVGRYARLVKEMSEQVQFIYITHNKIAMEMAEQMLGVTMQEPGCSRLVSVNLEEAVALAEQ